MKEYIIFHQSRIRLYNYWNITFNKDSIFSIDHRENDKPSFINSFGSKLWYEHGKFIKKEL